ncbi:hypothetical protein BJF78_35430 [Pseudonocardia sp. CNS-139]|nr:hypothetical protein BJF78_35430 [Pseudonocardia sp. CNS-139]
MSTTSEHTGSAAAAGREPSVVEPLLHELRRISGQADTERAAADQALIAELRAEISGLRAAVAHLRAGAGPLPRELRPVVARAMVAADDPDGGPPATA